MVFPCRLQNNPRTWSQLTHAHSGDAPHLLESCPFFCWLWNIAHLPAPAPLFLGDFSSLHTWGNYSQFNLYVFGLDYSRCKQSNFCSNWLQQNRKFIGLRNQKFPARLGAGAGVWTSWGAVSAFSEWAVLLGKFSTGADMAFPSLTWVPVKIHLFNCQQMFQNCFSPA